MQSNSLKQSLKQRHITMIALGRDRGQAFMGSGSLIASAGPAAILSYFIGGIVVTLVMFMLGEMACRTPMRGRSPPTPTCTWASGPALPSAGCTGSSR